MTHEPSDAKLRDEVYRIRDKWGADHIEYAVRDAYVTAYAAGRASVPSGEPVAWRTFDGEGGYEYRDYDGNEKYRDEYRARNTAATYWDWVEPLYAATGVTK